MRPAHRPIPPVDHLEVDQDRQRVQLRHRHPPDSLHGSPVIPRQSLEVVSAGHGVATREGGHVEFAPQVLEFVPQFAEQSTRHRITQWDCRIATGIRKRSRA